ncbi:TonB-linked outer membrane protein, SusC/RagA family [Pedobacter sp. ok626]|uniref:SusC/RagA family TonB-linked outer membrane protein n=1 Tax=Pedobacter sp. ok626 TaxID=1761882 RepID=UPI00088603CD|nr:SusC/RagA family TonB-linked outer membrane protein [Pedobacter sp. ok626]SDJ34849.1 TonB-linked outer membrane protein, SusC/RagA family [Pedobacter sp. ok626]
MKLTFLYNPVFQIQRVKYKLLLVMKLTAILLLIGTLHLSAASFSQTVTISRKNATLETILKDIKQQTGYLFFYTGKVKASDQRLNVELKNVPLDEALKVCLQNDNLNFTIVNKTIVLSPKGPDTRPGVNEMTTILLSVTGRVFDKETNQSIPGVNVSVKGAAARRAQTGENGGFKIEAQPGEILVFSYIGYKAKEVKVTDTKALTVLLESEVNAMKDVVITGYQSIKKDNYTGNAVIIKGDELKRLNPQNLLKSIQSFDPSFRLLDNNLLGADPNALPKINVRGSTALPSITDDALDRNNLASSYNLPVFIMDGFEVSLQKVTDLDINRIESITLLKDAAATAIYGSRAANGVMVITTKAPVSGKLQLSYNYELNVTAPDLSGYHVLNASQKLEYERLAGLYKTGNNNVGTQQDLDLQYYDKLKNVVAGVNTYWLSQPLRNTYGQKHSIYAQGGDSSFRYGVDLRYETNPGVMKGSGRDQYSAGLSFNYNPSRKLLFKNEITITQVNAENSKYGNFSTYVNMNPYYPIKDASGNLIQEIANWEIDTHDNSNQQQYQKLRVYNPLYEATLGNFDKNSYIEIIDAFSADWRITNDLRLKGLLSLNKTKSTADRFVSPYSSSFIQGPVDEIQNRGSYDYSSEDMLAIDGNLTLQYNKQVADHSVNLVAGANVTSSENDRKAFQARGFTNDRFTNIGFARTYTPDAAPNGSINVKRLVGSFISGNYSFKNRYLLDASFRLDGSSAFGADKRFAPFWALGAGWNIHNEEFMSSFEAISKLKLVASTGLTGSVSFPAYLSKSIYSYQTSNWYSTGIGAVVNGYGNEDLQWQKTTTYDVGLDIGLFKDRFLLTPRYYYKLTKGLLTDINIAPSTGFSTYKANLGDMGNKGFELFLTWNAFRTNDWNINVIGNMAHNTNKIVKIANSLKAYNKSIDDFQTNPDNKAAATPLLRYNEGQSLYTIYAVKSLGIDPENGKEIYVKLDGSRTYDYDVKDTQPVGDEAPKVDGNFGSNITYKQFMLSFSFFYSLGADRYNQTLVDRIENANPRFNVDSRALEQRWKKPGDITMYKNIADLADTRATSRFVQKENLLELRSVYLSYDLKKAAARKIGFQGLRAAITANDIFRSSTIEQERGITYPFQRSLTCSLLATF